MNWGKFVTARYIIGSVSLNNNFEGTRLENKFGNISEVKSFGINWGSSWKGSSWGSNWSGTNWGNDKKNNNWGGSNWSGGW